MLRQTDNTVGPGHEGQLDVFLSFPPSSFLKTAVLSATQPHLYHIQRASCPSNEGQQIFKNSYLTPYMHKMWCLANRKHFKRLSLEITSPYTELFYKDD